MKNASDQQRHGFSMVDLLLVIAAVVGIVCVILPGMARSGTRSAKLGCTNNLKQVGIAFRSWSLDVEDKFPAQVSVTNGGAMELAAAGSAYAVFIVMSNDLCTPKVLFCPEENAPNRKVAVVFDSTAPIPNPNGVVPFTQSNNISYFVGLDADETQPDRLLAGDDHFLVDQRRLQPGLLSISTNATVEWRNERHPKCGNVALADASVHSFRSSGLQTQLIKTGLGTNRLAMP
jgi:competence protein ComGC